MGLFSVIQALTESTQISQTQVFHDKAYTRQGNPLAC